MFMDLERIAADLDVAARPVRNIAYANRDEGHPRKPHSQRGCKVVSLALNNSFSAVVAIAAIYAV